MEGLTEQAPHLAPDIYPGATVTLWARSPKPAPGAMITVNTDVGTIAELPVRVCSDASATSRWAKARINAVDYDVMVGRVDEAAGRDRIITLSVTHSVLSKYTAWFAVDTSRSTESILPKRVVQPSSEPSNWSGTDSMAFFDSHGSVPYYATPSLVGAWNRALSPPPLACEVWDPFTDDEAATTTYRRRDLRDLIDELRYLLEAGRDHLDWQSISVVLLHLRSWLDDNDESAIDRSVHRKITRRLDKLATHSNPPKSLQWKVLNQLVEICDEVPLVP